MIGHLETFILPPNSVQVFEKVVVIFDWDVNVVILTKVSSLATPEVVKTSGAPSG